VGIIYFNISRIKIHKKLKKLFQKNIRNKKLSNKSLKEITKAISTNKSMIQKINLNFKEFIFIFLFKIFIYSLK